MLLIFAGTVIATQLIPFDDLASFVVEPSPPANQYCPFHAIVFTFPKSKLDASVGSQVEPLSTE
jgi:hypothetical protein